MSAARLAKRIFNRSLDLFFQVPAFDRLWLSQANGSAICLCYHRVDDPETHSFLTRGGVLAIPPADLERDLLYLQRMGAVFITFDDIRSGVPLSADKTYYIITFDDCYADNYTYGLQILSKLGIRAVFFQTSSMVDSDELVLEHALFWFVRDVVRAATFTKLAHRILEGEAGVREREGLELARWLIGNVPALKLERLAEEAKKTEDVAGMRAVARAVYPRREQLLAAIAAGHEIASHGRRHLNRGQIDAELFEEELRDSKAELTRVTGREPRSFAYPYGVHLPGDERISGRYYSHAVTTKDSLINAGSDPLCLGRSYWPGPLKKIRHKRWLLTGRF